MRLEANGVARLLLYYRRSLTDRSPPRYASRRRGFELSGVVTAEP